MNLLRSGVEWKGQDGTGEEWSGVVSLWRSERRGDLFFSLSIETSSRVEPREIA